MGTYGMETCVVFMDDGVFQLLPNQQADTIGFKNYAKGYAALPFYDIDEIYVCAKSIANRNIDPDKLLASPEVIAPEELQQKLSECHKVMSF